MVIDQVWSFLFSAYCFIWGIIHNLYTLFWVSSSGVIISACMCEILNNKMKCFRQKVQQETVGRHSDASDSFSLFRHQIHSDRVCVCVCVHSTVSYMCYVFSNWTRGSPHVCVSMTTAMSHGSPPFHSEAPQPQLCNTHTHAHTHQPGLCACVCVGVDHLTTCIWWVVSAVRLMFASPAPPPPSLRHATPRRPSAQAGGRYSDAKARDIGGPAVHHNVQQSGVPGRARWYTTLLWTQSHSTFN